MDVVVVVGRVVVDPEDPRHLGRAPRLEPRDGLLLRHAHPHCVLAGGDLAVAVGVDVLAQLDGRWALEVDACLARRDADEVVRVDFQRLARGARRAVGVQVGGERATGGARTLTLLVQKMAAPGMPLHCVRMAASWSCRGLEEREPRKRTCS
jgi:hypothetical protein